MAIDLIKRFNQNVTVFNISYFANGSKLMLSLPGEEMVSLMDILGRRIQHRILPFKNPLNISSINLSYLVSLELCFYAPK
jgi:hypothetical protein